MEDQTHLVPLILSDYNPGTKSLQDHIADHEELDYLLRSSQRVLKPQGTVPASTAAIQSLMPKSEEIMTFEGSKTEPSTEVEKLREENKRLKRTLVERFDHTFQ